MGVICAVVASGKGRSPVGWFLIGFLFSLLGLIILLVIKDLNEEKAQREKDLAERRRLEEQLRQERLKNEVFRQYTSERLDVHDRQLGVSTKDPSLALGAGTAPASAQLGAGEHAPGQDPFSQQRPVTAQPPSGWYYEVRGETMGPYTTDQILNMHASGEVSGSTLLWGEGSSQYVPVDQLLAR